jgi:hypothetical protein
MGYTFSIGNAVPELSKEYGDLRAGWVVEHEENEAAPAFLNDELTGHSNSRSPSYSTWHEFCKEADIFDVFYDERGRIDCGHPGCRILTQKDLLKVKSALDVWRIDHDKPPGFCGWNGEDEGKYDAVLARLIWLEWWMRWALENCETPAIQNT